MGLPPQILSYRAARLKAGGLVTLGDPFPVPLPLQPDDATEAAAREVADHSDDSGLLQLIEHLLSRGHGGRSVEVKGEGYVGLSYLQRMAHGIAQDDGPLSGRGDQQRHVSRGVTGRRNGRDLRRERVLAGE